MNEVYIKAQTYLEDHGEGYLLHVLALQEKDRKLSTWTMIKILGN